MGGGGRIPACERSLPQHPSSQAVRRSTRRGDLFEKVPPTEEGEEGEEQELEERPGPARVLRQTVLAATQALRGVLGGVLHPVGAGVLGARLAAVYCACWGLNGGWVGLLELLVAGQVVRGTPPECKLGSKGLAAES